ncbi:MAG: hypothetical protein ACREYF_24480 [Gammaproteobacteria bacterium]
MIGAAILAIVLSALPGDSEETVGFNANFKDLLQSKVLTVEKISAGMKIPLHSVIATHPRGRIARDDDFQSTVTLAFRRQDVLQAVLSKLLSPDNKDVRVVHLFARPGVETVVTVDSVKVTLHEGIIFHLRDDIKALTRLKTFISEDVTATVIEVRGTVLVSRDTQIIQEKLAPIWTLSRGPRVPCVEGKNCFKRSDGGFDILVDPELANYEHVPRLYSPRLEE